VDGPDPEATDTAYDNRRFLNWGVFFITAGTVVLLAQSALISDADVAAALRFWPILLIALGIGLLLRRTRFGVAGGMLAAAMPGLLLGGLIVAAPELPNGCDGDLRPVSLVSHQGTFAGPATVDLRLACGEVTVVTAPGAGWQTRTGNGDGREPVVVSSGNRLSITSEQRKGWHLGGGADEWHVTLPTTPTLDLSADVSAGRGTFDLAGARFGDVDLVVNAGDLHVDLGQATAERLSLDANAARVALILPAASDLSGDITVNAGALTVCAPDGLGLRIREQSTLAGFTNSGLVRVNDAWETPGYATAVHHADVSVTANVGSVDVNPEGGCK
jgi:hypothetical protein